MKVTLELELSNYSPDLRCKLAQEVDDATVLSALAKDESPKVRIAVAYNSNTLGSDLEQLARDADGDVISTAISNPNIPTEDLICFFYYARGIYYPSEYKVRKDANKDLPMLSGFDAYRVLKAIALNPNTPKEILAKLSVVADFDIRLDVAYNESTSKAVLAKLAQAKEDYMRETVAKNPNTPKATLLKLTKDKKTCVRHLAKLSLEKLETETK